MSKKWSSYYSDLKIHKRKHHFLKIFLVMNTQSLSKYLLKNVRGSFFVPFKCISHRMALRLFFPLDNRTHFQRPPFACTNQQFGQKVMTRKYLLENKFCFSAALFLFSSKGDKCMLSWFSFSLTIYLVGEFPWMLRMWNAPKQSQEMKGYAFCNLLLLSEWEGNKKYDFGGTARPVPLPSPTWLLQPQTLISVSRGLFCFAPGSSTLAECPE